MLLSQKSASKVTTAKFPSLVAHSILKVTACFETSFQVIVKLKMPSKPAFTFVMWTLLVFASLHQGWSAKCGANGPTVRQTQVGFGVPPKFMVEVQNNCPMCPAIDIHVKCGSFSQALVNPRLFKVLGYNDCVVNGGLPLAPLQKISFNYSHQKFILSPGTWYFQCE